VAVVGLLTLTVGVGTATHAYANPTPEEIESQLDEQFRLIEPIIEEYNKVRSELAQNRAKVEALQAQLAPLAAEVDSKMLSVKAIAVSAYKNGRMGAVNALLGAKSANDTAQTLTQLEVLARNQRNQVSGVADTVDKYRNDKRALDEIIAQQAAREADLAAKKKDIETKIADLEKKQRQLLGGGGGTGGTGGNTGSCPTFSGSGGGITAARTACAQLGKMYLYGAEGPDRFDCSGLTLYAWKSAGKNLPRTAADQWQALRRVTKDQLQVGDLIFFYNSSRPSHVGLYLGNGTMVHASRAGVPVKIKNVSNDSSIVGYARP
jgi:cell wall-associated NlpC family hydrolase